MTIERGRGGWWVEGGLRDRVCVMNDSGSVSLIHSRPPSCSPPPDVPPTSTTMSDIIPAIESFAKVSKLRFRWRLGVHVETAFTSKGAFATAAGLSTIGLSRVLPAHIAVVYSNPFRNRSRLALVRPELSNLPSVFPRGIEDKCVSPGPPISHQTANKPPLDVPVPTQHELPYDDLTLVTRDNVKIKCYLLVQRPQLNLASKATFESIQEVEDPPKKVGVGSYLRLLQLTAHGYSMPPLVRRL